MYNLKVRHPSHSLGPLLYAPALKTLRKKKFDPILRKALRYPHSTDEETEALTEWLNLLSGYAAGVLLA